MPIIVKQTKNEFYTHLISQNNHVAVIVGVWDVGEKKTNYMNQEKVYNEVMFRFEVNEQIEEGEYKGKNACINKYFKLSFHEKSNLYKMVKTLEGKLSPTQLQGYDLEVLIGKAVLLNIVHETSQQSGDDYAKITSISPLPTGMEAFEPDNLYIDGTIPSFVEKRIAVNKESLN